MHIMRMGVLAKRLCLTANFGSIAMAAAVAPPSNIRIKYFDIQGPAEPSRLALAIGGVPFEDIRVSFDDFKALKSSLPSGQLPILEADGEILTQSTAMANYCAKLAGLWPDDLWHQAKCDQVIQVVLQDIRERAISPTMAQSLTADEKLEKRKELSEVKLPEKLSYLESLLSPSGFFVGDAMTIADLHVYVLLNWLGMETLDGVPKSVVTKHEKLTAFVKRMDAMPAIKAWNEEKNPKLPWL